MVISTSEAIFLGNFNDADTIEATASVETPSTYLGTFGSAGDPLEQHQTDVTYDDYNSDNVINLDNGFGGSAEVITYDLGSGTISTFVDSLAVVNLTATYGDGTTQSYSNVVMYQDAAGNLFLTNSNYAGTNLNSGTGASIQSVNVTSITSTAYTGLYQHALQDFVCFAAGTMIRTETGEKLIETLRIGDRIMTKDRGAQELRWVGSRTVAAKGKFAPIMIKQGTMGNEHDLKVSPQHRMLVEGWKAELLYGEVEVLVAAKHLINDDTIFALEGGEVEYFHILFDRHEIVYANGAASESFHPGEIGMGSIAEEAREEIFLLFPELRIDASNYGKVARTSLKAFEAALLHGSVAPSVSK